MAGRVDRLGRVLAKVFGVEGSAGQVIDGVSPVLALEQEQLHPEWAFHAGSKLMAGVGTDTAVAAQFSNVGLRNPPNSGVIMAVHYVHLEAGGSVNVVLGFGDSSEYDGDSPAGSADSRGTNSANRIALRTNAATPSSRNLILVGIPAATTTVTVPVRIVVAPGAILWAACQTVNIRLNASFQWVERPWDADEARGSQAVL